MKVTLAPETITTYRFKGTWFWGVWWFSCTSLFFLSWPPSPGSSCRIRCGPDVFFLQVKHGLGKKIPSSLVVFSILLTQHMAGRNSNRHRDMVRMSILMYMMRRMMMMMMMMNMMTMMMLLIINNDDDDGKELPFNSPALHDIKTLECRNLECLRLRFHNLPGSCQPGYQHQRPTYFTKADVITYIKAKAYL